MKYRGVIFDLDGVIVFTDQFHYQAWKEMAEEMGIYFDEEINNRLRGVSRMDSLEIILERYQGKELSLEEKQEIVSKKNDSYRKLLGTMTPQNVSSEVRETLSVLRSKGVKIALGSSSKNARYILERVDLMDAFDKISDGNNIIKSKPDPEVFLKAAYFLGLKPQECLVVEDAEAGINAAVAGGMHPVAIGDAINCGKAEYAINSLKELIGILDL